jgi:DNA-binding beta-propeller fold protein YncE
MKRVAWGAAFAALLSVVAFSSPSAAADPPQFQVDPFWPKPLPNNWLFGQIGGLAVDSNDHVWVLQRPRSLTEDERGATLKPPRNNCCVPAPSVLEFDADGNFVQGWGGPGTGAEWVGREHGIFVDHKGFVWLGGNADTDSAIFKYTKDGKLVMEIGKIGPSKGSNDTTMLGKPADVQVDPATNEVFVADGYGNRRVIVFDADSGAYKRHWGAYGNKPSDDKTPKYDPAAPVSQQFGNPVHCAKVSKDGLVYVCDRTNNRIQVFKKDGTYVTEWFYDKNTLGNGAVWDLNFWPDAGQTYLLNIDGENNQLRVLKRSDGTVVGSVGRSGRYAGQFHWVHNITVDSKGNVYTGEVDNANRVQIRKGPSAFGLGMTARLASMPVRHPNRRL